LRFNIFNNSIGVLPREGMCSSLFRALISLHLLFPLPWPERLLIQLLTRVFRSLPAFICSTGPWMKQGLPSLRVKQLIGEAPGVLDAHSRPVLAAIHSLAEPFEYIIRPIWTPHRCFWIKEACLLSVWLECAFRFNTRTIYEFLTLLSPLRVLIETIELCKLALRIWLCSLLLLYDFLWHFRDLRLKAQPFCLLSQILHALRIDLFFDCSSVFH